MVRWPYITLYAMGWLGVSGVWLIALSVLPCARAIPFGGRLAIALALGAITAAVKLRNNPNK
jgi:hypothetical protein